VHIGLAKLHADKKPNGFDQPNLQESSPHIESESSIPNNYSTGTRLVDRQEFDRLWSSPNQRSTWSINSLFIDPQRRDGGYRIVLDGWTKGADWAKRW